jgi:PKD repeat protein
MIKKLHIVIAIGAMIFLLIGQRLFAQPATIDKNKHKDPMIMAPGYIPPDNDQITATVVTIDDYDNFKLGVDFAECSVANNPQNPQQFYAVWNSTGSAGGKGYYTNDGYIWTAGNPTWSGMWGDVVVSYDSLGNLAYQNMYGSGTVQGVKVAMSSDNGQTWGSPIVAMSGSDKNWIFSDQTSGPYSNYIYGIMTNNSSGQNFSRSTNTGTSWSTPATFNNPTLAALPGSTVCVGPEGDIQGGAVYAVANIGSSFNSTYQFYKSTDGGQTFTLKSTQQYANTVGSQVNGRNAVLNMRTRPYPFVAADNSYGPNRGRLYLVYASNNPSGNGNKPDIFCRYSNDGGATFSSAKVVNDDPNSQGNHNWFPAIWCEKNTGRLYISWMDTRDCPTSDSCMIYATYTDDGITFAPNQRISNKKMKINCNSCGGGGSPMYLGDYNGVAANPTTSMLAWTDFRDNNFGSYVAYFPDFGLRANPSLDTLAPVAIINAEIPSVKMFTDTVTVTATINAAPGAFTISYPQGNKLWSFPGQVPIQISNNGGAAIGDYTLNFTATGSNGTPIHKRTATARVLTPSAPTAGFTVSDESTCEGSALNFTDLSSGPPTSWEWTFPGGNPSSSTQQNPTNIVYTTAGVYDVTLTVTNQAGSNSITKSAYISVNTVPASPAASGASICEGEVVPDLTAEGESITWYEGSEVVGTGNSFSSGKTLPGIYTYTVTQTIGDCESQPTTVNLIINALPVVTFATVDSVCGNAASFNLSGGLPEGGIYSGTGVDPTGKIFDPAVAGTGNHVITYTYSDVNACTNSASYTIKVLSLPVVTFDPLNPVCFSSPAVTLIADPVGGTFAGSGVSGNVFDPAISGTGEFPITYSYSDPVTSCIVSSSQVITVNSLPFIPVNDTALCGNLVLVLDATIPDAGSYLWTPGNQSTAIIQLDTVGRGLGSFTINVTATDANSCSSTKAIQYSFFDCTGIEEPVLSGNVEIIPNPNTGEFTVRSLTIPGGIYNLKIYDQLSRLVYSQSLVIDDHNLNRMLNLRHLGNGIYLLRLENKTHNWSNQLIINR